MSYRLVFDSKVNQPDILGIDVPIPSLLVAQAVDATRSGDSDGDSRAGVIGPLNPFAQSR